MKTTYTLRYILQAKQLAITIDVRPLWSRDSKVWLIWNIQSSAWASIPLYGVGI